MAVGCVQAHETTIDRSAPEPFTWLARVLLGVALVLLCLWTVQRTTWYLAIDQFGYLTFAEDLAQGRVLHDWPLLPALDPLLPKNAELDVYAQTYIRRGDALFCRYSPGFPLILAAVRMVLGRSAEHFVNPVALVLLFCCLYAVGRRALSSIWLGLATALLVALLPNYVLLWSTSPLRDVPAHLIALSGLFLLLPGGAWLRPGWREAAAGLLLGYAVTTRNDAVLYLLPAGALALLARTGLPRRIVMGACGFAIGLAPLLAYNYVATGNPLRPTQAMEVNSVLSRAPASALEGWLRRLAPVAATALAAEASPAGESPVAAPSSPVPRPTPFLVQGGGLRLSHLERTLPANLLILRETFGDLALLLALLGAIVAVRTPALFLLVVPYSIVAVLFFSLWAVPGSRYLTGVLLLVPLLVLRGASFLASLPAMLRKRGLQGASIGLATVLAVVLGAFVVGAPFDAPSALPWVTVALGGAVALAAFAGCWRDGVGPGHVFAMLVGLALASTVLWRSTTSLGTRASFQAAQVERARTVVEEALDERAVVLTTTRIGRPAENLNYYTSAEAIYLEEMTRWQTQPRYTIARLLRSGFSVYLLLPTEYAKEWLANTNISTWYTSEVVRVIAPAQAVDYFVASPYHRGIPLLLVRMGMKDQPG